MSFSNDSIFTVNELVAHVKDKLKDQYNIIFLDSDDDDRDNKIFVAKGSSYYIWTFLVEGKSYGDIISSLTDLFETFGENEIKQVDLFLNEIIQKGFVECKN